MVVVIERKREFSLGTIQETSLTAKPDETIIEVQNMLVYTYVKRNPNCTMKQVSKGTGLPIQTICWRFSDLRKKGLIINSKTGKEMMWSINAGN